MLGHAWTDYVQLLVLFFNALDLYMHESLLGKDYEESPLCGVEELRFKQAPLSLLIWLRSLCLHSLATLVLVGLYKRTYILFELEPVLVYRSFQNLVQFLICTHSIHNFAPNIRIMRNFTYCF